MSRKHRAEVREVLPDPRYQDVVVTKFVNTIMIGGKKAVAEKIFYGAMDLIQQKTGEEPLKVFKKALSNINESIQVITHSSADLHNSAEELKGKSMKLNDITDSFTVSRK